MAELPRESSLQSGPGEASANRKSLDRALVRGVAWTGTIKWFAQILSWVATVVVARLLEPQDYGLVAMAGVFLGLIALMNEFGLGAAVVALNHLSEEQIAKAHSLACLLGVGGFILACLVSVPAGSFFRSSDLPLLIVVAGVGLIFAGMRSVPSALFEKELRFKFLALLEGGQSIVTTLSTIVLAWGGAAYWSLVIGGLVGHVVATIVLWVNRPRRYAWPSLSTMREILQFSSHVFVSRVSWYLALSADVFIGGRVLGQSVIGTYTLATTIATLPMEKVTGLASRVMPGFYSSVQQDLTVLRRYFLLLTEGVALITFPAGVGMALVASDFVPFVLGDKWHAAIEPLQLLAVWAAVRSVVPLLGPIILITGGTRIAMFHGIFCAITYPCAFWVGSQYGVMGLAVAWVVIQPPSWVSPFWYVFKVTDLSIMRYCQSLQPALLGVLLMSVCLLGIKQIIPVEWPNGPRLAVEVVAGALAYGLSCIFFHRARLLQLLEMVRNNR